MKVAWTVVAIPLALIRSGISAFGPVSSPRPTVSGTRLRRSWEPPGRRRRQQQQLWRLAMDALEREGDWSAYLDDQNTGLVYYFNGKTGEALWEPPTTTFPVVVLPNEMRKMAEVKRQEYIRKTTTAQAMESQEVPQSREPTLERSKAPAPAPVAEEKESWFDFLFDEKNGQSSEVSVSNTKTTVDAPTEVEEPNWFGNLFNREEPTPAPQPEPVEKSGGAMIDNVLNSIRSKVDEVKTTAAAATSATSSTSQSYTDRFSTIPTEETSVKIDMGAYVLPHPAKQSWGGEDAVFTEGRAFGVFDGVSGATKVDGVPLYSKSMAQQVKKMISSVNSKGVLNIKEMIKIMSNAASICDDESTGATTAIVASITDDGFLRVLNVGDSACIVIRDGKVAGRSREISHYFDCPYQLSADSPDRPRDGTRMNLELVPGDVIVMGSDGVFDNLSEEAIMEVVTKAGPRPSVLAKKLSDRSRKVSLNRQAPTPYAKAAQRYGDPDYENGLGGKLDDVSCVVARYE
jgi:protein phosphatase PTC7